MSNRLLLDDECDLNAEIGSKPWARAVARAIRFEAKRLDSDVDSLQEWVEIATEHEAWRSLGYISLDAFLIAEANFTQAIIDAVRKAKSGTPIGDVIAAAKASPLAEHGNQEGENNSRNKNRDNNVISDRQGNDTTYTLRRLARDCPEMLDRIEAGELSVNAAAIAAGIRKKPTPAEICVKAFRKTENRIEALKLIIESLEPYEAAMVRDMAIERLS